METEPLSEVRTDTILRCQDTDTIPCPPPDAELTFDGFEEDLLEDIFVGEAIS